MAKISARGAHKVAAFRVEADNNGDPKTVWYYRYVLRSDGKVLVATCRSTEMHDGSRYHNTGGYMVTSLAEKVATVDGLRTYLERRYGADKVSVAR